MMFMSQVIWYILAQGGALLQVGNIATTFDKSVCDLANKFTNLLGNTSEEYIYDEILSKVRRMVYIPIFGVSMERK